MPSLEKGDYIKVEKATLQYTGYRNSYELISAETSVFHDEDTDTDCEVSGPNTYAPLYSKPFEDCVFVTYDSGCDQAYATSVVPNVVEAYNFYTLAIQGLKEFHPNVKPSTINSDYTLQQFIGMLVEDITWSVSIDVDDRRYISVTPIPKSRLE